MRFISVFIILFLPLKGYSQNSFTISGSIDTIKNGEIWLLAFYPDSTVKDTAKIINGRYQFTGKLNRPIDARLDIKDGKNDVLNFILEPTLHKITGKGYPLKDWQVEGGTLNRSLKKYAAVCAPVNRQLEALYKEFAATNDSDYKKTDSLNKIEKILLDKKLAVEKQFITGHNKELFSAFLLEKLYLRSFDYQHLIPIYAKLSGEVKTSKLGRSVRKVLFQFAEEKSLKSAPDIVQKDTSGNLLLLSSLKGQYVLVDFWASWCNPCRLQNPLFVSLYNKYKNDGFTIFSVSYDSDLEKWKKAIVEDTMQWFHVSELNGWQNSTSKYYKIQSIPQNVLINREGKMVSKNLQAERLEEKLRAIFRH